MGEGFSIGPFFIHYYGILIMLGAIAAAWLADREARRRGKDSEIVWDLLPWVLIGGIIGARLWHVLLPPQSMVERGITAGYYLTHPLDAIAIWNGGLGIPGAVIGGAIALYIYARRRNMSFLMWVDIIAPGLALAQAIGRWGNFINQEIYGAPTDLPWAIYIEPQHRLPELMNVEYYHPLFLYESLWNIMNMAVLLFLARKFAGQLKNGDVFLVYLIIYPIGRFLLEYLRIDNAFVGAINFNQAFMGLIAIAAAAALFYRHWRDQRTEESELVEEDDEENSEEKQEIVTE